MTELSTFVRACALSDLPAEGAIAAEVQGTSLAVVRAGGEVFALDALCSHAQVELCDGDVYDYTIECPAHGSCFDVRTGKATQWPARTPVATYPVRIEGDDVLVSLGPPA